MSEVADFSVWGKIVPAAKREFRRWMAREAGWREIDVERELGPLVAAGKSIELFRHLGWEDACNELSALPVFVEAGSGKLTVTSFPPSEGAPYCEKHSLYVWNLKCPVCENNFIHRGRLLKLDGSKTAPFHLPLPK